MHLQRLINEFDTNLVSKVGKTIPEQGFQMRKYGCVIGLNSKGKVLLISKSEGECFLPMDNGRTANILPNGLYDKLDYFMDAKKYNVFREYHNEYFPKGTSLSMDAFLAFLQHYSAQDLTLLIEKAFKDDPKFNKNILVVFDIEGRFLHTDDKSLEVWRKRFKEWTDCEEDILIPSAIDGQLVRPIKNQLSVSPNRHKMFSDNKSIFRHYGLSYQCACSFDQSYKYSEAIKYMCNNKNHNISLPDLMTKILFWVDKEDEEEFTSFIESLGNSSNLKENIERCFKKMRQGTLRQSDVNRVENTNRVHILTLSFIPGQGRVVVRNYVEHEVERVFTNILRFTDLFDEFLRDFTYFASPTLPSIKQMAQNLELHGEKMQTVLYQDIFDAIVLGKKWSNTVINAVVKEGMHRNSTNAIGLAYVITKQQGEKKMNNAIESAAKLVAIVNKMRKELGYSCDADLGHFAANLQKALTELLGKSTHYIDEIRRKNSVGSSIYYEKMISELATTFISEDIKASSLTTAESMRFLLAYYAQNHFLYTKRDANQVEKKAEEAREE